MKLLSSGITPSPDTPGNMRSSALIRWGLGNEFQLWIDVPEKYADSLSETGNPWLVAMLPMAAALGEDIELPLPVDALLLENCRGVLAIWNEWYPELHQIALHCPVKGFEPSGAIKKTAAFFSGGIDSYFTIARRMPGNPYGIPAVGVLDDLLTVWGFDIGVNDETQFQPLARMLAGSVESLGGNHIIVQTNLRDVMEVYRKRWGPLTHGAGLAFIGLSLEKRYREVILGSTYPYGALFPWGSHPLVDPLFSTSLLSVMHDGAALTRIGKTAVAARLPQARRGLHVCQATGLHNCSVCEKCYRTMIALDILGLKESFAETFDWSGYTLSRVRMVYIGGGLEQIFYREMISAARSLERTDIAVALSHAARRSSRMAPFIHWAERMTTRPLVWRLGIALRRVLLRGSIQKEYITI
ncbi:MAG: hypothetical protein Q7S85_11505 [Rugosibacter sp.]|nr:hypothetical protein [Rugosibacter sp.]